MTFPYTIIEPSGVDDTGAVMEADTMVGTFSWKDHITGVVQRASLGPHSIKTVRR